MFNFLQSFLSNASRSIELEDFAYKLSRMIEDAIKEIVDIIDRIIPILNLKDNDGDIPKWKLKKEMKRGINTEEVGAIPSRDY